MTSLSSPTIIFDIDGTLASGDHRIHYIRSKPKNWPAYMKGIPHDVPISEIVWMLKTLHAAGSTILIATGRGEEVRSTTTEWLDEVAEIKGLYSKLYMRPLKDNRPDYIVKGEMLDQMWGDGYHPAIVFDDRDSVVKMWRDRGLKCLQVAEGNF